MNKGQYDYIFVLNLRRETCSIKKSHVLQFLFVDLILYERTKEGFEFNKHSKVINKNIMKRCYKCFVFLI